MQTDRRDARVSAALAVVGLLVWAACPARAEIIEVNASISAEVREFIDGELVSSDAAFEEFGATTTELPVEVTALLADVRGRGHVGLAAAEFEDPARITDSPNPQEFALEVDCYSTDPSVSYEVSASATETRTIRLRAQDLPADLGDDRVDIFSRVFFSGTILLWSVDASADLTGMTAEVTFEVFQHREGEEQSQEVFSAATILHGGPDGTVETEFLGPVFGLFGGSELLTGNVRGDDTLPVVPTNVIGTAVDALGGLYVLLVPAQEWPYPYRARPDEEFQFEAVIETRIVNLPGGTGVAATFGRPFANLADVVDATTRRGDGAVVQSAVNKAQAEVPLPMVITQVEPASTVGGRLCGALGAETAALASLLMVLHLGRLGRRMRPRS